MRGLRASPEILVRGGRPASALWGAGISGDLPIALVRISEEDEIPLFCQMLRAHEYWRQKRLAVDLVILNERASSYAQDLQKSLEATVHTVHSGTQETRRARARYFLLRPDLIGQEARDALRAAARIDLSARRGSLAEQLNALADAEKDRQRPSLRPCRAQLRPWRRRTVTDLQFFNGFGGFSADGREYVML